MNLPYLSSPSPWCNIPYHQHVHLHQSNMNLLNQLPLTTTTPICNQPLSQVNNNVQPYPISMNHPINHGQCTISPPPVSLIGTTPVNPTTVDYQSSSSLLSTNDHSHFTKVVNSNLLLLAQAQQQHYQAMGEHKDNKRNPFEDDSASNSNEDDEEDDEDDGENSDGKESENYESIRVLKTKTKTNNNQNSTNSNSSIDNNNNEGNSIKPKKKTMLNLKSRLKKSDREKRLREKENALLLEVAKLCGVKKYGSRPSMLEEIIDFVRRRKELVSMYHHHHQHQQQQQQQQCQAADTSPHLTSKKKHDVSIHPLPMNHQVNIEMGLFEKGQDHKQHQQLLLLQHQQQLHHLPSLTPASMITTKEKQKSNTLVGIAAINKAIEELVGPSHITPPSESHI